MNILLKQGQPIWNRSSKERVVESLNEAYATVGLGQGLKLINGPSKLDPFAATAKKDRNISFCRNLDLEPIGEDWGGRF